MEMLKIKRLKEASIYMLTTVLLLVSGCKDEKLNEVPLDRFNEEQIIKSKAGFDLYITALHEGARQEMASIDLTFYFDMFIGTDVVTAGQLTATNFNNYETYLTPYTNASSVYWNWAYRVMIPRANAIISNAEREDIAGIWESEAERNAIIAEGKFFRAYTYNILANLYGGVPIVDAPVRAPKLDFQRASRDEVYAFAKSDLEFAAQWLPTTVDVSREGRIVKAAALHLLTEVNISLGQHDDAIAAASSLIDPSSGYQLMTERFGVNKDKPGDVFSDLFVEGNQNRSTGNRESIFVIQFEDGPAGGEGGVFGNNQPRGWLPFWVELRDPNNVLGIVNNDTTLRGIGRCRPTTFFLYELWAGLSQDMRNSRFNIRRDHYYNNPASAYFGQQVEPRTTLIDTMQRLYPVITKVEGKPFADKVAGGRTGKDMIIYRLGETYLLRAEAYIRKGDLAQAAEDINALRRRAQSTLVSATDMTIDFLLDERARELIAEEPRRRTLMRMGKLVERVRKYNMKEETRNSIADKHELYPIPQSAIDANYGQKIEQNPDY